MIIWRMGIACCITTATNTHSEYVTPFFPRHQSLRERIFMLRYTYIVFCLSSWYSLSVQFFFSGMQCEHDMGSSEHGLWLWARWIFSGADCRQRHVLSLNRMCFPWLVMAAPRATGWTLTESGFDLLREEKRLSSLQSPLRPGALKPSYKMGRSLLYPKTCSWILTTKIKNAHSYTPIYHTSLWHSQELVSSVAATASSSYNRILKDLNTVGSRFTTRLRSRIFGRKSSRRKTSTI